MKCFDQVNREIVFKVCQKAGMPNRVLDAYHRYIDGLQIRFQTGQNIGQRHQHVCSIPQGCPFSMMIIALMFVPWVKEVKADSSIPRTLADDLLILNIGVGHRARTIHALRKSKEFV